MVRIKNEYIRRNLGVTNIARKMRKNRLKQFGYIEKKNIIKKTDEIKVKRNRERSSAKKKWMTIIEKE